MTLRTCARCADTVTLAPGPDGRLKCPICGAPDPEETAGAPAGFAPPTPSPRSLKFSLKGARPTKRDATPDPVSYADAHELADDDAPPSFQDVHVPPGPPSDVTGDDVPLPFSPNFLQEYRFVRVLGHGGMGAVYLMNQVKLDRLVAVKVVKSGELSSDQSGSLLKEAKVLAHLNHAAIVAIHDVGEDAGMTYMVSEYVEGETLAQRLRRQPPLTLMQALRLGIHLLDGLKVAHKRGIIHRDLKPGNILLDAAGKPKIGDFGLARAQHIPSEMSAGKILGTPEYMSPEQCHGRAATAASDIYSTGVVLFELITGQRPFRGPGLADYLLQHAREQAPRARSVNPDLSAELDELIARALEKDPAKRVRSAADFRKELLDIVRNVPAAPGSTPPHAAAPPQKVALEPAPGLKLADRYELVRVLGQGGMGQVWLANDLAREGAEVAVKLLPPELWRDAESRACLIREGNLSLKLSHPSVVRLINLENADAPFLVMEYVPGSTLSEVLAARTLEQKGPLRPDEALKILEPVASALDHAHEKKIIHRDMKPSNIILESLPDGSVAAKLADFGIAAEMASFRTRSTGVVPMGTLLYMSPEQVACARLDGRSDIYSLGATLYQMLTLTPPYYGGDVASAIKSEPVPRPPGVAEPVAQVVMRAMAKNREDRPQSAGALVAELRRAVDQLRVLPSTGTRSSRTRAPTMREVVLSRNARSFAIGLVVSLFLLDAGIRALKPPKPRAEGAERTTRDPLPASQVAVVPTPKPSAAATPAPPVDPTAELVREGLELYRQARYDEALARFRSASELHPDRAEVQRRAALCLVKLERPADALSHIERALALAPKDPALLNSYAMVLLACGDTAKALAAAVRLTALPAPTSDHWDTLGQAQRASGNPAEARASFQKALALDPANLEADQNLRALD